MKKWSTFLTAVLLIFLCCKGEKKVEQKAEDFMRFPITSLEGVITQSGVTFDTVITSDGNGSLLIDAKGKMVVRLFEIEDPDVENARIIYQAKLRTKELDGDAYLEILCDFKGLGTFFGRGLDNYLTWTTQWSTVQTSFLYNEDENPTLIKLNLIITGPGKVWIDDIRLQKGPLNIETQN